MRICGHAGYAIAANPPIRDSTGDQKGSFLHMPLQLQTRATLNVFGSCLIAERGSQDVRT